MIGPAVLYVPGGSARAVEKAGKRGADALIFDLEDAVAPAAKGEARETLRAALGRPGAHRPRVPFAVRINGLGTPEFAEDLLAARAIMPDVIALPKVEAASDLRTVETALAEMDAPASLRLWAMIETPRGVLDAARIAAAGGRLAALVAGTNDLALAARIRGPDPRQAMKPWLSQIVLAARAHGLVALDGVRNDWDAGFEAEAREAALMGFDGKTLIHPAQIAPTWRAFAPDLRELDEAREIVAAFSEAGKGAGVLRVGGRMVERLHLEAAQRLLALAVDRPEEWENQE